MTLLRSASLVSLFTLVSRVAGLVRELLIASLFGASVWTDAFNVAFRIPNLLRRLFAEGAFSQAFVPLLAATRAREGDDHTRSLVNAVGTVLLWVMAGVCVLGVVGAPVLVWVMASGFEHTGGFAPAVVMTRWMFPYIGCMAFVALSAGVLNTWGRFSVPAATPVTTPFASTVATLPADVVQVSARPESAAPFASFGVAERGFVRPMTTSAVAGVSSIELIAAGGGGGGGLFVPGDEGLSPPQAARIMRATAGAAKRRRGIGTIPVCVVKCS